ncbi:MAG: hypothetical protein CVT67_02385 [Actinobacteria bacterium HGW-Actinobacteria-7]|jgi:hypothetical protein|nr:MAG: hypothetical protein CVT67_02385 [Actinobacteria bacterium HGW-Actinobacteria-7]
MSKERSNNALQIIFSFFLGLMVLALIGIGVNTFYPSPQSGTDKAQQKLYSEQQLLDRKSSGTTMSAADQARYAELQKEIDALNNRTQDAMQGWQRNTSIVLIVFATLVMSVSLVRSEQLRVISNGLLLGGLFTMVYGVGWMISSGESIARFVVIVFAFGVTVALGYLKFVRSREEVQAPPGSTEYTGELADAGALGALAARVEQLEARNAAAAAAFGLTDAEHDR